MMRSTKLNTSPGMPGPSGAHAACKDGHPKPFAMSYVEVGNEDNFDRRDGGTYKERFAQFFDAIKAKYPQLQVIATIPVERPHARSGGRALLPEFRG